MRPALRGASLRQLPPEVGALVAVSFMVALGFGVVAPAIPLFARHFGVSKAAAGAVLSAFAFARLITAPLVGRVVDRLGERLVLALGIGIVAASSALAGLADSYWQLLVLRGVGGVGSIMFSVASSSLLIRVTPDHLRGRAQGVYAGGFLLGTIAGPALGFVAAWSLRAPFFLYAATLVGAGAIALRGLRPSELAAPDLGRDPTLGVRDAVRLPAYRTALATNLIAQWTVSGVRTALVPLYVSDVLHRGSGWTYAGFFVVSVVSALLLAPTGHLADSSGRRPVLLVGLVAGAAGLALVPLSPSLATLFGAMALLGVASAALSVAPGAMLGDVLRGRGGTVVATFQMAGDAGSVVGPVLAGRLADGGGYGAAFGLGAVVTLLPIVAVVRSPETRRDRVHTPVVPIPVDPPEAD
ncbi:MAG: MFS transporter [Actinobacteria bacterium]|nr:MFS transporter [Actinomycetota bacterium]